MSIHEHQTRQGADLRLDAPTLKATWPFDYVNKVRPRDNLKKLNLFHKTYAALQEKIQQTKVEVVTDLLLFFLFLFLVSIFGRIYESSLCVFHIFLI